MRFLWHAQTQTSLRNVSFFIGYQKGRKPDGPRPKRPLTKKAANLKGHKFHAVYDYEYAFDAR